jgi:predicted nucleotidyltransferase
MFKFPETNLTWLKSNTIFLTKHGSRAYGTNTPTSDEDFKGVAIAPMSYYYGFANTFEQAQFSEPYDMVVYDIRKFFKLAADCNPSIIEVLFTDEVDHVRQTHWGHLLVDAREKFLSLKAKHTFSGYAMQQMKRIRAHHNWTFNPPKAAPTRDEFNLPERTVIPADQLKAAQAMIRKQIEEWNVPMDELDDAAKVVVKDRFAEALALIKVGSEDLERVAGKLLGFSDNFLELLDKERGYKGRMEEWRQYQNWKATRNAVRSDLEQKYGYDTKHGMHLVRLMRMGEEILRDGKVIVKRPDADELLSIRNGAWSYEKLMTWAEEKDKTLDELYKTSKALPHSPDRVFLNELCLDIIRNFHS